LRADAATLLASLQPFTFAVTVFHIGRNGERFDLLHTP
jgi:hypothetical protein